MGGKGNAEKFLEGMVEAGGLRVESTSRGRR